MRLLQYRCDRCGWKTPVSGMDALKAKATYGMCGRRLNLRGDLCTGLKSLEEVGPEFEEK